MQTLQNISLNKLCLKIQNHKFFLIVTTYIREKLSFEYENFVLNDTSSLLTFSVNLLYKMLM